MDDAFQGVLPTRINMGLVNSEASSGSFKKNPFNFQSYTVDFLSVVVDHESLPGKPIQVSFDSAHPAGGNYLEGYMTLFTDRNIDGENVGVNITRSDYSKGYTIYAINFEPDIQLENNEMWPALMKIDKARYITV